VQYDCAQTPRVFRRLARGERHLRNPHGFSVLAGTLRRRPLETYGKRAVRSACIESYERGARQSATLDDLARDTPTLARLTHPPHTQYLVVASGACPNRQD
jgi:hypothetical protein